VGSNTTTLTEHWNCTSWSVVPSPNVGGIGQLSGVAAVSTYDVWAVGSTVVGAPPLIEHWNGTRWRIVKAPKHAGLLNGITALSANNSWAVGSAQSASGVEQTLIEHWTGHRWSVVSSP
jgi:hypothetical protein